MAQIIPPIVSVRCQGPRSNIHHHQPPPLIHPNSQCHQTSLPVDSNAAPSVEDIQDKLPSICVDYLSHNWTEEDVWASWRNMTRHKHEIANGVRLENASWRTWNKQRNKLKTISPETLNW